MQNRIQNKKISVIIPTLNRSMLLKEVLKSVINQTFPSNDYEIIVIDNGSTDETKYVCMEYRKKCNSLYYIYDDRPGLHIGRNRGFLESNSNILVYLDDDVIAFPTLLEAIYKGFEDEKTVLIGGNIFPLYKKHPPKWVDELWVNNERDKVRILQSYSVIEIGDRPRKINPGWVFGCNFAVRKEIIKQAGGFHPDGVPNVYLKYRGDGESYISEYIRGKK